MLESTEAKVYFIPYRPEMEEARGCGELRVNSFVRMRNISATGAILDIQDLGNAEALLSNRQYFRNAAMNLLKRGITPIEHTWGGRLGRYQAALAKAATEINRHEQNTPAR
jgi:hypothetical protein